VPRGSSRLGDRARAFYEGTLGFTPAAVLPGGVRNFGAEGTAFFLFPTQGKASGTHTQMGFTVTDIEAEMADLKSRGVVFESYDFPAFDKATSIATFPVNRSAWFKDTEGNLLGIVQFI
jgi:catechol 2,3-dioxygenase-like lactoylglutathione lyase family enzyme